MLPGGDAAQTDADGGAVVGARGAPGKQTSGHIPGHEAFTALQPAARFFARQPVAQQHQHRAVLQTEMKVLRSAVRIQPRRQTCSAQPPHL